MDGLRLLIALLLAGATGTAPARADSTAQHTAAANTALALDVPSENAESGTGEVAAPKSELTAAAETAIPVAAAPADDVDESPADFSLAGAPASVAAVVQTAAPATPVKAIPIPRRGGSVRIGHDPNSTETKPAEPSGSRFSFGSGPRGTPWYRNTWVALAAVLALIFGAAKLLRKCLPSGQTTAAHGVRLLGRTALGAKHAALLLHVGQRVVLVGQTGDRLNTLAEFSDPVEVALLLGKTVNPPEPPGESFANRLTNQFDAYDEASETPQDPAATNESLDRASGQLTNLVNRLRALQVDA
jgi:flagellar biogenesis protein FliO